MNHKIPTARWRCKSLAAILRIVDSKVVSWSTTLRVRGPVGVNSDPYGAIPSSSTQKEEYYALHTPLIGVLCLNSVHYLQR